MVMSGSTDFAFVRKSSTARLHACHNKQELTFKLAKGKEYIDKNRFERVKVDI
jgi:hypothetical protein